MMTPTIVEGNYIYKGVTVAVRINYRTRTITLVEPVSPRPNELAEPKKWLFKERELDYMQGWQNILDAMKYAVAEASKELKAYIDQEEAKKAEQAEKILINLKR